jgi:hypothetical protein
VRTRTHAIITARQSKGTAPHHVRPHVTHDACEVPPEKAHPLRMTAATTAIIKWPGSLQGKDNPPCARNWSLKLEN